MKLYVWEFRWGICAVMASDEDHARKLAIEEVGEEYIQISEKEMAYQVFEEPVAVSYFE